MFSWHYIECVVHEANEYEIVVAFILEVREAVAMPALVFHWNSARFNLQLVVLAGVESSEQIVPINIHHWTGDTKT